MPKKTEYLSRPDMWYAFQPDTYVLISPLWPSKGLSKLVSRYRELRQDLQKSFEAEDELLKTLSDHKKKLVAASNWLECKPSRKRKRAEVEEDDSDSADRLPPRKIQKTSDK